MVLLFVGCSSVNITSTRLSNPVKIDGYHSEWGKTVRYIENQEFSLGISHTDDELNLCLVRSGKLKMSQLLLSGFTIWIYPENQKIKSLGINISPTNLKRQLTHNPNSKNQNVTQDDLMNKLVSQFKQNSQIKIITKKGEILENLGFINDVNIDFGIGYNDNQLTFEISIPLIKTEITPYAVAKKFGEEVKIRLKSNSPKEKFTPEKNNIRLGTGKQRENGLRSGSGMRRRSSDQNRQKIRQIERVPEIDYSFTVKF